MHMHAGTHRGMHAGTHTAKPVLSMGMGRISLDQLPLMKASHHSLFSSCLSCLPLCPVDPGAARFLFLRKILFCSRHPLLQHLPCPQSDLHRPQAAAPPSSLLHTLHTCSHCRALGL